MASLKRTSRRTFIVISSILVALTALLAWSPSWSLEGFSFLAVLWIILGYVLYVNAALAYGPEEHSARPWLSVGKGIPAWAFFLAGGIGLTLIAAAWVAWGKMREAIMLVGISMVYVSMTYPRRYSLRRAILSGIGLAVASGALVLLS
jgi:hypothetical protein